MQSKIVTAYAYSQKSKVYIYAAYVLEWDHDGLPKSSTFKTICNYVIDEDKAQARVEAIERIYDNNGRHSKEMAIEDRGRKGIDFVTGYHF